MIRNLHLRNFKSWPDAKIEFGKITALFGTNSSGKSSLIQFILLLKQTKEATDRNISLAIDGNYTRLGVFKDIIFKHDESKPLQWSIGIERDIALELIDSTGKAGKNIVRSKCIRVDCIVGLIRDVPSATYLSYHVDNAGFTLSRKSDSAWKFYLHSENTDFSFIRTKGRAWDLPGPVKSYAFPDQAKTYHQNANFLSDLELVYESELDNIFYLGPLRQFPQRDYLWARSRPHDVGTQGEKAINAILAATVSGETRNVRRKARHKPFQEIIAYWLREMGLIEDFRVEEIAEGSNRWQARVITQRNGVEVLLTDIGFGVSQVLPVITLLQYVPEGATVILEQPEIHLHPLAQANLADVIINAAVHRNVNVIVESHSEHFLLRLQRRIAEGNISAEDSRMYFCDTDNRGDSRLTTLELDLLGNIRNWPENFMGDAFGEASAAEIARLKRMQADTTE